MREQFLVTGVKQPLQQLRDLQDINPLYIKCCSLSKTPAWLKITAPEGNRLTLQQSIYYSVKAYSDCIK